MSVLNGIKKLLGVADADMHKLDDSTVIDIGDKGEKLYKDNIIAFVKEELERRRAEKLPLENQWNLNANFLAGNQYCEINPYRGDIEQLEPVYDWLEREAFNQISPLVETRIANLKKINYMMKVNPRTNELDDYAKADISTTILQYIQKVSDFEKQKNTMILWNELCGSCYWIAWWDSAAGEYLGSVKEMDIGTESVETKKETAYFEGDVKYGLITPYEVFPESIFRQGIEGQRTIILEQVKTVEEIYDLYGIEVEGREVESFQLTPLVSGGGFGYESTRLGLTKTTVKGSEKVITYFEKPGRKRPHGRMIIIVGDDNLVYYGDLPYDEIPIVQCLCREVAGQFFGKSAIEDLIPRQIAYNGCLNRIHEYIKTIAIGRYIAQDGAIDIDEYEQNGVAPGAVLTYRVGAEPPVPMPNGQLPQEIMTERYNLKTDMEYVAGTSQLMVSGNVPSGVVSGAAINNLMEIDNTRLSLTGDYIRNSVRDLAKMLLKITKKYATSKRVLDCAGLNSIGHAIVWCSEDINSYDVEFTTENELLMSEDVQRENFFNAFNMGFYTDENGNVPQRVKQMGLEYMKLGKYTELMNINHLHMQVAQRENSFFEKGVISDVGSLDDHDIHIEEHTRYALQMRFRVLKQRKPEYALALEKHIEDHKAEKERKKMEEIQKIRAMQAGMIQ